MTENQNDRMQRRARSQAGFSLLEMGIAITLMGMIFIGAWTLFVTMSRTTMRSQAEVFATAAASNALQYMIQESREAFDFKLPQETSTIQPGTTQAYTESFQGTPSYPANFTNSYDPNYQAKVTLSGTIQYINTAVVLYLPPADAGSVQFRLSDGSTSSAFTSSGDVNHELYWRGSGSPGLGILFYRSDSKGNPAPSTGQYLWEYSLDNGATVNKALVQLFDTAAAAANVPNAVQFDRPTALPFQLEMKIVCGNYSPINGVQTNEASNGTDTSSLTGKCVLMRDHCTLTDELGSGGNYSTPVDNKWVAGT